MQACFHISVYGTAYIGLHRDLYIPVCMSVCVYKQTGYVHTNIYPHEYSCLSSPVDYTAMDRTTHRGKEIWEAVYTDHIK